MIYKKDLFLSMTPLNEDQDGEEIERKITNVLSENKLSFSQTLLVFYDILTKILETNEIRL